MVPYEVLYNSGRFGSGTGNEKLKKVSAIESKEALCLQSRLRCYQVGINLTAFLLYFRAEEKYQQTQ